MAEYQVKRQRGQDLDQREPFHRRGSLRTVFAGTPDAVPAARRERHRSRRSAQAFGEATVSRLLIFRKLFSPMPLHVHQLLDLLETAALLPVFDDALRGALADAGQASRSVALAVLRLTTLSDLTSAFVDGAFGAAFGLCWARTGAAGAAAKVRTTLQTANLRTIARLLCMAATGMPRASRPGPPTDPRTTCRRGCRAPRTPSRGRQPDGQRRCPPAPAMPMCVESVEATRLERDERDRHGRGGYEASVPDDTRGFRQALKEPVGPQPQLPSLSPTALEMPGTSLGEMSVRTGRG